MQGRDKSSIGDWMQYLLFKHVGLNDLANEKGDQLGIGHQWQGAMNANGDTGMIRYGASGKPLEGVKSDGSAMNNNELAAYASQGLGKASDVSLTPYQANVNGELHTINIKRTANGVLYQDATAGTGWTRQAPAGMTHAGQQDPTHLKGLTAANAVVTKMAKANQDAIAVGGQPLYSQQQIEQARNSTYETMTGKPYGGGQPVTPVLSQPSGATVAPNVSAAGLPSTTVPSTTVPTVPSTTVPTVNKAKSQAQSILDYDSPPPVGPTTPAKIALQNEVQRLAAEQGKTYDAGQYKIANKTKQDFTTGKQGQAVQSMNTAIAHLDTLDEAGQALHSGQIPLSNKIVKEFATNMGLPQYTNFESIKHVVGSEIAKAVSGSGGSALADRQAIEKEFDSASSPDQLQGVVTKYKELMAGQVNSLRQTYTSAGLSKDSFDNKLLPRTQKVLNSVQPPTRSKW